MGKSILFAYSECGAQGVEWSPRASFHIFRVRLDGTELAQLTDGPWNEFDPCFLPNGRIAFISERRGGYLRCGGSAPPMILRRTRCIRWRPMAVTSAASAFTRPRSGSRALTNDGRLVYTRWDYVDRDTNVAHHIWTCLPDGSDPRSFHGNYPCCRESRPWMEMDIRAIPGVTSFCGHRCGTPRTRVRLAGADRSSPTRRRRHVAARAADARGAVPRIGRRQGERSASTWSTAPRGHLAKTTFLCVYDPEAVNHGVYWIDRCGNRELLYRDPSMPCLSPIPVRTPSRTAVAIPPVASVAAFGVGQRSAGNGRADECL